jgi:MFS superfamily sulfate permease-like transporter
MTMFARIFPIFDWLPSYRKEWIRYDLIAGLTAAAVVIALMSFVETAAAGRAFIRRGDRVPDANRELVATGVANLAGSLFHIMPAGGGTLQTAVNDSAGARSQVAGLVTAGVVMATLLFLAPLFGLMPHPTLAAVVVIASIGLISPAEFRSILKIRSMEFRWALIAVAGVLLLGILKGILVAVLVSLLTLIVRANRYPIKVLGRKPIKVLGRKPGTHVFRSRSPEHPDDETFPGLLLLRPHGAIYFANAPRLGQEMRALMHESAPREVALDFSAVPNLEFTALRMLTDGEERLREEGTMLWLVAMNPDVLTVVQHSPLWEQLGRERIVLHPGAGCGKVSAAKGTTSIIPSCVCSP